MKCFICTVLLLMLIKSSFSLIPEPCANIYSLNDKICCPNKCGESQGRGTCASIHPYYSSTLWTKVTTDIRYQWPTKLFEKLCVCNKHYGGFDCSECEFGYTMDSTGKCIKDEVKARSSLDSISDWNSYIAVLNKTKYTKSRYFVITQKYYSFLTYISNKALKESIVNPNLYDLFIWVHHFAAMENEAKGIDFAHESTEFLTWHRLFLLWIEREIQVTIPGQSNFRLHYWDWTIPSEREKYFKLGRLNLDKSPFNKWPTFCWMPVQDGTVCNPTVPTRYKLRRCPSKNDCASDYPYWPSTEDVCTAVNKSIYDSSPYNKEAHNSFRNYLEGFNPVKECKSDDKLCDDSIERKLHNSIHILLGIGNFRTSLSFSQKSAMGDVAASPNDPIFFNHHTMIDCIMEQWIQSQKCVQYPTQSSLIHEGHRGKDYIVPFIPLYTQ